MPKRVPFDAIATRAGELGQKVMSNNVLVVDGVR